MKNFIYIILILSTFIPVIDISFAQHQNVTGKNISQQFHHEISQTYETGYLIYLPEGYESDSKHLYWFLRNVLK